MKLEKLVQSMLEEAKTKDYWCDVCGPCAPIKLINMSRFICLLKYCIENEVGRVEYLNQIRRESNFYWHEILYEGFYFRSGSKESIDLN